jgi:hypothetical protein
VNRGWAFVALLCAGCGSKGAVSLVAGIDQPMIEVGAGGPLASSLKGTFMLHVELGQVAPSGTDVSIGALSLVPSGQSASPVALKFVSMPVPPYHLEPGGKVDAMLTIADNPGSSSQTLTPSDRMAICSGGTLQITGTLSDTVSGQPTPVSSSTFTVMCP